MCATFEVDIFENVAIGLFSARKFKLQLIFIQDTLNSRALGLAGGCLAAWAECVARAKVSCIQGGVQNDLMNVIYFCSHARTRPKG